MSVFKVVDHIKEVFLHEVDFWFFLHAQTFKGMLQQKLRVPGLAVGLSRFQQKERPLECVIEF